MRNWNEFWCLVIIRHLDLSLWKDSYGNGEHVTGSEKRCIYTQLKYVIPFSASYEVNIVLEKDKPPMKCFAVITNARWYKIISLLVTGSQGLVSNGPQAIYGPCCGTSKASSNISLSFSFFLSLFRTRDLCYVHSFIKILFKFKSTI